MIAPATLRHAAQVSLRLRAGSADTMHRARESSLRALCHAIRATDRPQAWLENGKAIAIGGVAGGPLGLEGIAWVAFTEAAIDRPHALIRRLIPFLIEEKRLRPRLMTAVDELDDPCRRLVEWCGFRAEGPAMPGFIRYAWEREA